MLVMDQAYAEYLEDADDDGGLVLARTAPNVLITPHVAAATDLGEEPRWLIARENLRRYVAGGKLLSEVSVEKGY